MVRDAPKDRVDERNRDKGDRDRNDRDRADRDRDTRVDRDSRSDRDRSDRDRSDRDREDVRPKEKKLTRAELEALKKERVALVKRLTHGKNSPSHFHRHMFMQHQQRCIRYIRRSNVVKITRNVYEECGFDELNHADILMTYSSHSKNLLECSIM